jgi:transposase InsO family protein
MRLKVQGQGIKPRRRYVAYRQQQARLIEEVYKNKRLHSALGYQSSNEFEDQLVQRAV